MTDTTRNEAASRLLANSKVRTRVSELQREARERHDVTVDTLSKEYDVNRALALEMGQPGAANGSTAGKARLHGLDKGGEKNESHDEADDAIAISINFV